MSLTRKVSFIIVAVFMLSVGLSIIIQQLFVMPSFLALEKEAAIKNSERVSAAIERELDQISPSVSDWAYWTDTYKYVSGDMPEYPDANLDIGTTLDGMKINYLGIYDPDGIAVWSQGLDLDSGEEVSLGELTDAGLRKNHPLLQFSSLTDEVKGLIRTDYAPMLVVAKPILTNERTGPAAGTMIMGRFLNDDAFSLLSEQTKLLISVSTVNVTNGELNNTSKNGLSKSEILLADQNDMWQASTVIADLYGSPALNVQVYTQRDISARGSAAVRLSLLLLIATGVVTMFTLLLLLQRILLQPITMLTKHATRIGENDDLTRTIGMKRKDEIGILARTFDDMVEQLAGARSKVVNQSYKSGVAEMASGVLHNIGNAITPLNVQLSELKREISEAPIDEIEQAVSELADPDTPSERCRDLEAFDQLAKIELIDLVKRSKTRITAAAKQVDHVQEILKDQEKFSHSERVLEPIELGDSIKESTGYLSSELKNAIEIEISTSIATGVEVFAASAPLQQIISNLLINAAESVQLAAIEQGKVSISGYEENVEGQQMFHLLFDDNGVGIESENINKIFQNGFSTKGPDNSGFGLHWCANTVRSLGGQLSAESEGLEKGACFHLFLPLAKTIEQEATGT